MGGLQLAEQSTAGEQKAFPLPIDLLLRGCNWRVGRLRLGGLLILLLLNGLAFPSPGHSTSPPILRFTNIFNKKVSKLQIDRSFPNHVLAGKVRMSGTLTKCPSCEVSDKKSQDKKNLLSPGGLTAPGKALHTQEGTRVENGYGSNPNARRHSR